MAKTRSENKDCLQVPNLGKLRAFKESLQREATIIIFI